MRKQVDKKTKGPRKFNMKMQKKLVVLFIIVLLAFVGLTLRLIWITRENGEQYNKQILSQQKYDSVVLPFRRGDIVDAKGTKLAVSEKIYNLVIDSKVILTKDNYFEPTMQALGNHFDLDMSVIREYVKTHPKSSYYVPLKQLSYDEIHGFLEEKETDSNIRGIWFEEEFKRIYPMSTLASDVIGFTSSDNRGTYGLEEYYNDMLNGTTGREFGYLGEDSVFERTVKSATDGYTIHSTIDANIQSIVEKYLKQFDEEHRNNAREGNGANNTGCIIMKVNTGEVLAMASYPNYDLNQPRNIEKLIGNVMVDEKGNENGQYITTDIVETLEGDLLYQNFAALWKNFCIANTYEPGSTAKPFTSAMGLENGALSANDVYQCNGHLVIGGHKINCHNTYGDGPVTMQDAIAWSCNVALMEMAEKIGINQFTKFQQIFNFGLRTNVDLAGESRTASLVRGAEQMDATDLATYSFGQNFNVTMIQLITGFCSLINGGYYYEPHLVNKITSATGATIQNIEPRILKQTISESTSELVKQYCRAVVMEEGGNQRTGRTARPAGYAIGGKTGTAQTLPRGNGEYVVSFIGYAPAENPEIAIYVVVDRVNETKQDEAKYATGIVRNILTEVLPYLNIFMTEELSDAEQKELEEKQLAITNQYMQTPEEDDLLEHTDEIEDPVVPNEPIWSTFPIDSATGYRVDPNTGEFLDPNTGDPIYLTIPAIPE